MLHFRLFMFMCVCAHCEETSLGANLFSVFIIIDMILHKKKSEVNDAPKLKSFTPITIHN